MLEDRIRSIEARIQASTGLPEATRTELLAQLSALEAKLGELPPEALENAPRSDTDDLASTLAGLEAAHPELAAAANRLALALSNMGI